MKMTLNINEEVLEKAIELTNIKGLDKLVNLSLETVVKKESAKRLAKLGGSEKNIKQIPRGKIDVN